MRDTLPLTETAREMSEEHSKKVITLIDHIIKTEESVLRVVHTVKMKVAQEKDARELVKGYSHNNADQVAAVMATVAGVINLRVQIIKLLQEAKSLKRKNRLSRLNIRRILIQMLLFVLISTLQMQVFAHDAKQMNLYRQAW